MHLAIWVKAPTTGIQGHKSMPLFNLKYRSLGQGYLAHALSLLVKSRPSRARSCRIFQGPPALMQEQVMSPSAQEVAGAMANGTQALSGQADPGMRTRVTEAAGLETTAGATLPATHDGIPNNPTFPMASSMRHEGSGLDSYGATQHAPSAAAGQINARDLTGVSVPQSMLYMASPGMPQLTLAVPQEGQLHAAATPDDFFMHLENADGVEEHSAGSPGTTQPPALRWMTRLTEFLRTKPQEV